MCISNNSSYSVDVHLNCTNSHFCSHLHSISHLYIQQASSKRIKLPFKPKFFNRIVPEMTPSLDLSFYLVTDSTMVPSGCSFLDQVQLAVDNGVTLVQLREKKLLTRDFIQRARDVLQITRPRGIPLIINDRVDVALAVDADGVHVGQDDMPATTVRKLIGPGKILGVSCGTPQETQAVCDEAVADYVGLGTCYPTSTKNVKSVVGPIGIRKLLHVLNQHASKAGAKRIESVAIGGINHTNVAKVLFQCAIGPLCLDGVAIVSCVMASNDAKAASQTFVEAMKAAAPWIERSSESSLKLPFTNKPLVHHITNNVVKNFSANVTLAIGASPIMSELSSEFEEFAALQLPVGLLVNLGTPNTVLMDVFLSALKAYNNTGKPILFDPVAAGATPQRLEASRVLLNAGQFSVIKGNLGEIMAIEKLTSAYEVPEKAEVLMQGVDSLAALSDQDVCRIAARVSTDFRCIVVVTGKENFVVDASKKEIKSCRVPGGNSLMGSVTGTGCSLGSVITAFIAHAYYEKMDMYTAVLSAVKLYNYAGRHVSGEVSGPGSFASAFLDSLHSVSKTSDFEDFEET